MSKTRLLKIWVGMNGDGNISMHCEQPIRDDDSKIWVSIRPFCNSVLYKELQNTMRQANMTWESDTEYFEIPLSID